LLSRVLYFLSIPFVLLDDIIMTSPVLLTDVVLLPLVLLAIVVGEALIGVGGVKLICTTVLLNLTNFLVLTNPTPIQSLNHYPHNGISYLSCRTSSMLSQASRFSW
jgi:hypothetical protein